MTRPKADRFPTATPRSYPSPEAKELYAAILKLKTVDETARFFRDLLTIPEIKEFANRWQMVKLLYRRVPYATIAKQLKVSTTTVTRVAWWLRHGAGGYKLLAPRMFKK